MIRLSGGGRARWKVMLWCVALVVLLAAAQQSHSLAQVTPVAASKNAVVYHFPLLLNPVPQTEVYTSSLIDLGPLEHVTIQPPKVVIAAAKPALTKPARQTAAQTSTPTAIPSSSTYCPDVVQRVGSQLLLNGEPFTFVGVNVSYLLEDYFPESEVPGILAYLSESGCTVLRVWFFPQHDYDRAARLFDLGRKYNLRFVVTLVNYYYDKGAWWFDPSHYTTEYLPHVRAVVARFRERPEILAWELMNEPNCSTDTTGSCPGNMLRWADTVSKEIKALDPCHLISTGTIRIDPNEEHYRNLHALETIDFVSIHKTADLWLQREIDIAIELNKPVLIGEVFARGYDGRCNQLYDGAFGDRVQVVAQDIELAWQNGVDGYLLWQYGHGRLEVGEQVQHYCGEFDYLQGDPIWELLKEAPVSR